MKRKSPVLFVIIFCFVLAAQAPPAGAQGHFEFGFHYSRWSINLLRSFIEEGISNALKTDLKGSILEDIQADYPNLEEVAYDQKVAFDSSGDNFGFEIRWYPGGSNGSFSLGLSVEKTSMKVAVPEISASLSLRDAISGEKGHFAASSAGEFLIKPLSFHVSLRWDIIPSSIVHPYITFGLGAATGTALEEARVTYSYSGDLILPGRLPEHYKDSIGKTLKELKVELEEEGEDFFLPGFIPFIQLSLGLKAKFSQNIHLLLDAGIWNGFLLRGGVSVRL
ncbi:MAG: hypothetical protein QHH14_08535 [Clostridiales bacterium]|nr:hypothetical protein [Clostridiales bacterium]